MSSCLWVSIDQKEVTWDHTGGRFLSPVAKAREEGRPAFASLSVRRGATTLVLGWVGLGWNQAGCGCALWLLAVVFYHPADPSLSILVSLSLYLSFVRWLYVCLLLTTIVVLFRHRSRYFYIFSVLVRVAAVRPLRRISPAMIFCFSLWCVDTGGAFNCLVVRLHTANSFRPHFVDNEALLAGRRRAAGGDWRQE